MSDSSSQYPNFVPPGSQPSPEAAPGSIGDQPTPPAYGRPAPLGYGQPMSPAYGQSVPPGYGYSAPLAYGQPVPSGYGHPVSPADGQRVPSARRVKPWMIIVGAASVLVVAAAAVTTAAVVLTANNGPNLQDAQRECRTAFEQEFDARKARLDPGSGASSIITSMTGIDVQESRKTDAGFEVNGVVHYDLTGLFGSVHNSLSLTCEAKGQNGKLVTTVKNRT